MLTLYSMPACLGCRLIKVFLEERGLAYEERDVWADEEAARELARLTGQGQVPVVRNGSRYVVGLDPEAVARLAEARGHDVG